MVLHDSSRQLRDTLLQKPRNIYIARVQVHAMYKMHNSALCACDVMSLQSLLIINHSAFESSISTVCSWTRAPGRYSCLRIQALEFSLGLMGSSRL